MGGHCCSLGVIVAHLGGRCGSLGIIEVPPTPNSVISRQFPVISRHFPSFPINFQSFPVISGGVGDLHRGSLGAHWGSLWLIVAPVCSVRMVYRSLTSESELEFSNSFCDTVGESSDLCYHVNAALGDASISTHDVSEEYFTTQACLLLAYNNRMNNLSVTQI